MALSGHLKDLSIERSPILVSRPILSLFASSALILAAQVSPVEAQKAAGPKLVSVTQLSPTERLGTIDGLPSHHVRGSLKSQPPHPPRAYLEENEEKQPAVPMIDDGLNIPPEQRLETHAGTTRQTQAAGTFVILRDSPLIASLNSSVNEPNVGSQGDGIFTTHNWYAETSTNNGGTFSFISPFSTFPSSPSAFSAGFCCDQRVAQDSSRNLIFWYLQYIKNGSSSSSTNGVRVAVTHGQAGLATNSWTYYDFTPALFGLPAGTWFDFPQMQASANYLYFTTNVFRAVDNTFYGAVAARLPLSQLDSGVALTFNYFTVVSSYGSILPVNGAAAEGARPGRTVMYFAAIETSSSLKVITWPEAGSPTFNSVSGLASIALSAFTCPGPGGLDPCTRANARLQTGWITDTELGFMWNAAQNGSARPYPYVRAVLLNPSTLGVLSQPDIFNTTNAWLYPAMSVNERGHLGGTVDALGGNTYPAIVAIIRDDFSPDPSTSGWEAYAVAGSNSGTPGLYGDYNGSMPHEKYPTTWLAAGHTQVGGSNDTNAVTHNYWFGRQRDAPGVTCYPLTRTHTGSGSDPVATPANSSGCSTGQYTAGATLQVNASPSAGWNVGSWSGTTNNGSTSTANTVTMPSASQTVTVNYVQPPPACYPLTRTHTGSGNDPVASPANSSGCSAGQYTAGAAVQLTASPAAGWTVGGWSGTDNNAGTSTSNSVTMPVGSRTATVNYVVAPASTILLVDDDNNNPDVRSSYTAALSALGKSYQLWDTGSSDNEPGAVALQAYQTVIWFSGSTYGGTAGPGASGEADLATFLSLGSGRCLLLSSQDYFFDRGMTSFMTGYLGLGSASNDVGQTVVQGQGSAFSGLGPYSLSFPFVDYSDGVTPAAGAEMAFTGTGAGAAISRIGPNHRTIFLAFPFEALPTAQARQEVMAAALDYCATIFADVPPKFWARRFIEAVFRAGVTNGCADNPRRYCPTDVVTRGSMAQLLLAAKEGPAYVPPACTSSPFSDIAPSNPLCPWVQELVHRGVTAGCGGGQYCPNSPVTRAQMSVFLLATLHGSGYVPAPCTTAAFSDVPASSPFCPWVQEMAARGITAGCGGGSFCASVQNTRDQLAVFLVTTFGLPLQ
jgi:hypothetical protein